MAGVLCYETAGRSCSLYSTHNCSFLYLFICVFMKDGKNKIVMNIK